VNEQFKILLPEIFFGQFSGHVVVTQGFDQNILAMPVEAFQGLSKLLMGLNIADPLARSLQRLLLGNASFLEIQSDGTIILPERLSKFAGVDSEIVIIGQGKYFEVWSKTLWQHQEFILQDVESNCQKFASMDLSGM